MMIRRQQRRCGKDASFALVDKIGRRTVRCECLGRDRYKRVLGGCWLGDADLNAWMVSEGWAVAWRRCANSTCRRKIKRGPQSAAFGTAASKCRGAAAGATHRTLSF
jgi:endonuclease YncB( thermonuclease family)